MKKIITLLMVGLVVIGCESDDSESCETLQPIEQSVGETRISFTWRDITSDQIISDYEIQYGVPGFELGTGATTKTNRVTVSSDPDRRLHIRTFNSLPYDTAVDFYYRSLCGNDSGEYQGPISLRTLEFGQGCTAPADLILLELKPTTATIQWEGYDETLWNVSWGSNDGTVGGDADVSSNQYQITDLEPGLTYLVGVMARCTGTDFTISALDMNPKINFTTPED